MLAHIAWLERWVWFVFCVQMLYDFWHDGIGLVYLEKILWLIHIMLPSYNYLLSFSRIDQFF